MLYVQFYWPKIVKKWSNMNQYISVSTDIDEKQFVVFEHITIHLSYSYVHLPRLTWILFFFFFSGFLSNLSTLKPLNAQNSHFEPLCRRCQEGQGPA